MEQSAGASNEIEEPEKKKRKIGQRSTTYMKDGLTRGFHGCIYQFKLLMLFILHGKQNNYEFSLATEMVDAESFDDIVLQYSRKDIKETYFYFLQAKHKQDESKKFITDSDLWNSQDKDFKIQIYFQSYHKIRNKMTFSSNRKFVLCTNINIDKNLKDKLEEDIEIDTILNYCEDKMIKKDERFKIKYSEITQEIKSELKKVSDCYQLGKLIGDIVNNKEKFDFSNKLLKMYQFPLFAKVFESHGKANRYKLRRPFLNEEFENYFVDNFGTENNELENSFEINVPVTELIENPIIQDFEELAKEFAELMEKASGNWIQIYKIKKIIKDNYDVLLQYVVVQTGNVKKKWFQLNYEFIYNDELPGNLNNFRNSLEEALTYELCEYKYLICEEDYLYLKTSLPKDEVTEDEIKEFLDRFVIAVNQPNDDQLEEILKNELKKMETLNTIEKDFFYSRFYVETLNWMKKKTGTYISNQGVDIFFENLVRNIRGIILEVPSPVESFIKRDEKVKEIHDKIEEKQLTVIAGRSGVGKTELAKQYIEKHGKDYDNNVVWINAAADTIETSFRSLWQQHFKPCFVEPEERTPINMVVTEICEYFQEKKCLFIFDNFQKNSNEIISKIDKNNLNLLFTTQETTCENLWKKEDLIELETCFDTDSKSYFEEVCQDDKELIDELGEQLQNSPLARRQAKAYLMTEKNGIKNYLEKYNEISIPENYDDSERIAFRTCKLAIDAIRADKQNGSIAINILNIIAYCFPEEGSTEIFNNFKLFRDKDIKEANIESAIKLLEQYAIVNSFKQKTITVHDLVKKVTINILKEQKLEIETLQIVLQLVNKTKPTLKKQNEILDMAIIAFRHAAKCHELASEFYSLPRKIINVLYDTARYNTARSIEDLALPWLKKGLGKQHKEVAIMLRYRANAYGDEGDYENKKILLKKAVNILKSNTEENKIELAKANRNLANAYGMLADRALGKQKALLEEVLKMFKEELEEDDIYIAKTKRNLATLYAYSNTNEGKQLDLLQESLPIFEEEYGHNHLEVAKTHRYLGMVYRKRGNKEQSLEHIENAKNILERCQYKDEREYKNQLALTERDLGIALQDRNKLDEEKI